tara:strand:+ start:52 stop:309 length:258 start_codon:yes stop_codon:yes gene_type:complete
MVEVLVQVHKRLLVLQTGTVVQEVEVQKMILREGQGLLIKVMLVGSGWTGRMAVVAEVVEEVPVGLVVMLVPLMLVMVVLVNILV